MSLRRYKKSRLLEPKALPNSSAVHSVAGRQFVLAGILIVMTLLAYLPAIHGGFIWDDNFYVESNRTLRSMEGLWRIWFEFGATQDYYPLTFSSFWVEYQLWGLTTSGYHLTNILLHALNAVLLWRLLLRLNVPGAYFAAALFAVHPVHVESVAWITERKNVLSCALLQLSVHAFLTSQSLGTEHRTSVPKGWYYLASVSLFLLALFSKSVSITLPFILPVITWWQRGRIRVRDLLLTLPYFVVATPIFYAVTVPGSNFGGAGVQILGSTGELWNSTLGERFIVAGRCLWFYAAKLHYPVDLCFVYPRWRIDGSEWWQYLYPITAFSLPVTLWFHRHRWGRGPLAAVLIFGLNLAPASGFFNFYFQRYSFVADHLQYLASIGLVSLFAAVAVTAAPRLSSIPSKYKTGSAVAALLLFGLLTWQQCHAYTNLESLWRDTLRKNSNCEMAHTNLGVLLRMEGRLDEALEHFQKAKALSPREAAPLNNLGTVYFLQGRLPQAIETFEQALKFDPQHAESRSNLGIVLNAQGRSKEAIELLESAVEISPRFTTVQFNLASVLQAQGQEERAVTHYEAALRLDPDHIPSHQNLAVILRNQGKLRDAAQHLDAISRIQGQSK